jgi:hypothetical protein
MQTALPTVMRFIDLIAELTSTVNLRESVKFVEIFSVGYIIVGYESKYYY